MLKIKNFNTSTVSWSRKLISKKLEELKEHGIGCTLGNIRYDDNSFTVKLTVSTLSDGGEVKPEWVVNWESGDWRKHGLRENHLGQSFKHEGDWHIIVGCKSRRCKYGVIGKCMKNDKLFSFNHRQLNELTF